MLWFWTLDLIFSDVWKSVFSDFSHINKLYICRKTNRITVEHLPEEDSKCLMRLVNYKDTEGESMSEIKVRIHLNILKIVSDKC